MFKIQVVEQRRLEPAALLDRIAHGVDGGIAGDKDLAADTLPAQILGVGLGGREVQVRDIAHQGAVHLLGEGRILIIGAKAGLHMAHGDLVVKGRQRPGKGGGGVAVDQNHVRPALLHHLLHAQERLGGDGGQGLPLLHDIEVEIAAEVEDLHDGIEHLPVLARQAADALQIGAPGQRLDQRRHFDGLGTGAENGHDFILLHGFGPLFQF